MSLKSVTVFTKDLDEGFAAWTFRTEAFAKDEQLAAKRAAARFFAVPADEIDIASDWSGVFTAKIARPAPAVGRYDMLWAGLAAVLVTAGLLGTIALIAEGGVK